MKIIQAREMIVGHLYIDDNEVFADENLILCVQNTQVSDYPKQQMLKLVTESGIKTYIGLLKWGVICVESI